MGQQATLRSPFANFNMVSVCVGMALGAGATPHHHHLLACSPLQCPFDLALNHRPNTTHIDILGNYAQITSALQLEKNKSDACYFCKYKVASSD